MTALEQFVITVRTMSVAGSFDQLNEYIQKNSDVLLGNGNHLDDCLATFTLQEHSLGILGILVAKLKNAQTAANQGNNENQVISNQEEYDLLLPRVKEFVDGCHTGQVRAGSDLFASLCHIYSQTLVEIFPSKAIKGINVVKRAILKIQTHPAQLTSMHSDLALLCLTAKCIKPALSVLDIDITEISKENGHFDVKYFLQYYYYGGMCYTAVKNLERALYFFEAALTTQSMAVSQIMVEAYKKYVLISLILHGKTSVLPKYAPPVVNRYIRHLCEPYCDLANLYTSSQNPNELGALAQKQVFSRDNNEGLVKQVIQSQHKKNIQRLTKTFLTLSISDVASRVFITDSAEAEDRVVNMIESDDIYAAVNQKDGMVVFLDNPEKYNSVKMFRKLEEQMRKCIAADEQLKKMDQDIAVSVKYNQKLKAHDHE